MSHLIVKAKKTYLKSPLSAGATSVVLRYLKDSKDNNINMSSFGDFGVLVIKQGEVIEMLKFTNVSYSSDDTATVSVATNGRNLNPTSPYAGFSTGKSFQSGAEVIITNDPLSVMQFGNLNNENLWLEQQTFDIAPKSNADAVADDELVNLKQLNDAVLGDLTLSAVVVSGIGGEALAVDTLVYQDDSNGKWYKSDADTNTKVENVKLGYTRGACAGDGSNITNGITLIGLHEASSSLYTANTKYFASNTAGELSASAGTFEVAVGFAISTTKLIFYPRYEKQLTKLLINALVGNNIEVAVGSGNKFVTQTGLIKSIEKFGISDNASNTDFEVDLSPAITEYTNGMQIYVYFTYDNTNTTPTLNVNGLGAKTIQKLNGLPLEVGDIGSSFYGHLIYDGIFDVFILLNPVANPVLLSDVYPYVPNSKVEEVLYRTIPLKILVAGPDSSSAYFFAGWSDTNIAPSSGALSSEGGVYEFPCSGDQSLYTILPPIKKGQENFRFGDLHSSYEVRIKFDLIPKTVVSGEVYGWGISNSPQNLNQSRTNTTNHQIRFVLEENGGVDKLWAVNSNGTNYNATDITGSLNLGHEHIFELVITSTSIKYYVDGVLVATHTTYISTLTSSVYLGYAFEYNGTGGARPIYPAIISLPLTT